MLEPQIWGQSEALLTTWACDWRLEEGSVLKD